MGKRMLLACSCILLAIACQKSLTESIVGNPFDTLIINNGVDTGFAGNYEDTGIIRAGDKVTYEVITQDTTGWYGVWNDSTGKLVSNGLDHITYGSPNPLPSGWKYSFICPNRPFQALLSAASFGWQERIVIKLYKNDRLIKAYSDSFLPPAAHYLETALTDDLPGTNSHPALTYEVFIKNANSAVKHGSWFGQWRAFADGKTSDFYDDLLSSMQLPSGWRYSFYPDDLPFTMGMSVMRLRNDLPADTATINFYKNGELVKSIVTPTGVFTMDSSYVVR